MQPISQTKCWSSLEQETHILIKATNTKQGTPILLMTSSKDSKSSTASSKHSGNRKRRARSSQERSSSSDHVAPNPAPSLPQVPTITPEDRDLSNLGFPFPSAASLAANLPRSPTTSSSETSGSVHAVSRRERGQRKYRRVSSQERLRQAQRSARIEEGLEKLRRSREMFSNIDRRNTAQSSQHPRSSPTVGGLSTARQVNTASSNVARSPTRRQRNLQPSNGSQSSARRRREQQANVHTSGTSRLERRPRARCSGADMGSGERIHRAPSNAAGQSALGGLQQQPSNTSGQRSAGRSEPRGAQPNVAAPSTVRALKSGQQRRSPASGKAAERNTKRRRTEKWGKHSVSHRSWKIGTVRGQAGSWWKSSDFICFIVHCSATNTRLQAIAPQSWK